MSAKYGCPCQYKTPFVCPTSTVVKNFLCKIQSHTTMKLKEKRTPRSKNKKLECTKKNWARRNFRTGARMKRIILKNIIRIKKTRNDSKWWGLPAYLLYLLVKKSWTGWNKKKRKARETGAEIRSTEKSPNQRQAKKMVTCPVHLLTLTRKR